MVISTESRNGINISNVPEELRACNQWLLWKYETDSKGRKTKVPYSPAGVMTGSQRAEWNLDKLVEYVGNGFSGVGFAFKTTDRYCGFDYDAKKDANGNIIERVLDDNKRIIDAGIAALVEEIGSYTEISPSGEGIHIIFKGDPLPGWKTGTNRSDGELYFSGRYFTITGNLYEGAPREIKEINPETLKELYNWLNPPEEKRAPVFERGGESSLSEREIIDKLMSDSKARDLFLGNIGGYKSQSEADAALCCKIAFFTRSPSAINSIFSQSGLYRDKWKRADYSSDTINSALDIVKEEYAPARISAREVKIGEEIFKRLETKENAEDEFIMPQPGIKETPKRLLTVPGILGKVVEYYEATAPKSQPQFAVQAALALGSVAMGRRWVTDWNNWSSLFFINVGKSSAGKEYAGTIIMELLERAECTHLIGTSKYSSGSAVYSELQRQPTHIGIIDEFGKLLESTKRANNSHGMDALSVMMQMWGRCNGFAQIPALSTLGATEKQKKEMQANRTIKHPALTVIAMTTPSTFYNAITIENVTSGFIPRFIIVESEIGRQKTRKRSQEEPPHEVISWIYRCAHAHSGAGNLTGVSGPDAAPDPIVIPITSEAEALFDEFEGRMLKEQDHLDIFNISEVLGRTNEIAMKLSLIVAVSCGSFEVLKEHAEWAIEYADYYARQTVDKIKSRVSNSDFEAICNEVIEFVRGKENLGATRAEISKRCPLYKKSDDKVRDGVMRVLGEDYDLVKVTKASRKGRGGPGADRYIVEQFFNESDWV